jgi:hypothetical protein
VTILRFFWIDEEKGEAGMNKSDAEVRIAIHERDWFRLSSTVHRPNNPSAHEPRGEILRKE